MKARIAMVAWHNALVLVCVGSVMFRHSDDFWQGELATVRLQYDLFSGVIALVLLGSIAGLMLKRRWGLQIARMINSSLIVTPLGPLVYVILRYPESPLRLFFVASWQMFSVAAITLGLWIFFELSLKRTEAKTLFI